MPPIYLGAVVNGQVIRYLHSTPPTLEEARLLANDMNSDLSTVAYYVEESE
ncbi:MAG: hypothetical protein Q8R70_00285 [Methanoregula sp.]|nr:hypothetical protein [Methanoregula sp.]